MVLKILGTLFKVDFSASILPKPMILLKITFKSKLKF